MGDDVPVDRRVSPHGAPHAGRRFRTGTSKAAKKKSFVCVSCALCVLYFLCVLCVLRFLCVVSVVCVVFLCFVVCVLRVFSRVSIGVDVRVDCGVSPHGALHAGCLFRTGTPEAPRNVFVIRFLCVFCVFCMLCCSFFGVYLAYCCLYTVLCHQLSVASLTRFLGRLVCPGEGSGGAGEPKRGR